MAALILAMVAFSRMSCTDILVYARAILNGMMGNPAFPDPPVDMGAFSAAVQAFANALIDALDGSKSALAARDSNKNNVILYMRQLAPYVETKSNGDEAIFISSGFRIKGSARKQSLPMDPVVRKVLHGPNSGSLLVYIQASVAAWSYLLRVAALDGDVEGPWQEIPVTKVKSAIVVSGLTPGVRYAFQVRALKADGTYTDWSDSVTIMCV